MRKAIRLQVTVWVEGEDEPAHDFFASTSKAVRDVVAAGAKAHPELRFTVKRVREDEGD
ncbi:MAG TPA: hypothetical protein VFS44_10985 [Gemmatimonadaceae bacterium]|nr:hypothetical protein [Gemmatimonadaceae bacterium]